MKAHPLSEYLPELPASELKELANDIKANGLREAIVLLDGQILDGRNRFAACKIAKVEPAFVSFEDLSSAGALRDVDPLKYVASMNLHRRHLNETQRAAIADEMSRASERGRPAEEKENGKPTMQEAAQVMNVPVSAVKRARAVRKKGSEELKKKVKEGKVSLSKAAKAVKAPKSKQVKAAKQKDKPVSIKEKLLTAIDEWWDTVAKDPPTPVGVLKQIARIIERVMP